MKKFEKLIRELDGVKFLSNFKDDVVLYHEIKEDFEGRKGFYIFDPDTGILFYNSKTLKSDFSAYTSYVSLGTVSIRSIPTRVHNPLVGVDYGFFDQVNVGSASINIKPNSIVIIDSRGDYESEILENFDLYYEFLKEEEEEELEEPFDLDLDFSESPKDSTEKKQGIFPF